MWPTVEIGTYGWGSAKQNIQLLSVAKTFHLQTALAPEFATPPRWLSSRYASAPPDSAELLIFVRSQNQTLSNVGIDPRFGTPRRTDVREGTVYQLVITDQKGDLVFAVAATSVTEMWTRLDGTITAQLQRRAREEERGRRDVK
jgi:hypothetical protein